MLRRIGPADAAKIGHPARNRDVAQVAPAMQEHRAGKARQAVRGTLVVRHLVHEPRRLSAIQLRRARQMGGGHVRPWQPGVSRGSASRGGPAKPTISGKFSNARRTRRSSPAPCTTDGSPALARSAWCPARQTEDEHRPARVDPAPRTRSKNARAKPFQQHIDELLMFAGRIVAPLMV